MFYKRALTGARYARDHREPSNRNPDIYSLQVVLVRSTNCNEVKRVRTAFRNRDAISKAEIATSCCVSLPELSWCAGED